MKNLLLIFLLFVVSDECCAQQYYVDPVMVPQNPVVMTQPVVVQEMRVVPVIENKIYYYSWIGYPIYGNYQPIMVNQPVIIPQYHRCRLWGPYRY